MPLDVTAITATLETVSGEYEVLAFELVDELGDPVASAPTTGWRLDVRQYEGAPVVAAWASEPAEGEGEAVVGTDPPWIVFQGLPVPAPVGAYQYAITTPAPEGVYVWARGTFIVYPSTHQ